MRIVGIIAEFNPFHNGHRYLVDQVRRDLKPDAVIAVMSGNFVQRGEPAMWNKWVRAQCAVENGLDLIFELPVCFSANSGEEFSRGAVRVLKGLNIVTDLAFGSETGNKSELENTAACLSSEDALFSKAIKDGLKSGLSYPSAYEAAFHLRFGDCVGSKDILKGSNDILALEYIKQNIRQGANFNIVPIKRKGFGHDRGHSITEFASASIIRKQIKADGGFASSKIAVPKETFEICQNAQYMNRDDEIRYFTLVRNALLCKDENEIASLLSVSEGLEYKLKQALTTAKTRDELILSAKSKRHTYAKISRILLHAVLGIDKNLYHDIKSSRFAYGHVLAFNSTGSNILRQLQDGASHIPIYTNVSKSLVKNAPEESMLSLDCKASDIYSLIRGIPLYDGSDFVNRPYIS